MGDVVMPGTVNVVTPGRGAGGLGDPRESAQELKTSPSTDDTATGAGETGCIYMCTRVPPGPP